MRITAFRLHTASLYQASKIGGIIISRNVAIDIRSDHIVRETILSCKLRCYTRIISPEKSRNNTREKIRHFFTLFDIANQQLTRHSPFAPLGQVDEWTAKPSPFSIHGCWSEFSRIMIGKLLKNPYGFQTLTFKLSYDGKKTKIRKEKPKVTRSVALVSWQLRTKIDNWKIDNLFELKASRFTSFFLSVLDH